MKRKQETLLVSSIGLLVIILILLFSAKFIVLKSFLAIEAEDTREHLQRITNTIDHELEDLAAWAGDYASWDETYRFIQDGNAGYAASNLSTASLAKLKIDLIALVRPSGEIIFAKALNSKTAQPVTLPADLNRHLTAASPLVHLTTIENSVKGVLVLSSGPLLVVAKPILTSNGRGPIRGSLILGRAINAGEISRMANLTRIPLEMVTVDRNTLTAPPFSVKKPLSLAKPLRVKPLDDDTINGYALFGDLYQQPALLIKATISRHIYTQGVKTLRYFLACCGLISLASLIAINWGLGKYASSQLYEEKDRLYAAALTQTATAVMILDADSGRIVQANAAVSLLLGFTPAQLEGTLIRELLASSQSDFEQCRETTLKDQHQHACALQLMHHDSSTVSVTATASVTLLNDQQYLCLELRTSTPPG